MRKETQHPCPLNLWGQGCVRINADRQTGCRLCLPLWLQALPAVGGMRASRPTGCEANPSSVAKTGCKKFDPFLPGRLSWFRLQIHSERNTAPLPLESMGARVRTLKRRQACASGGTLPLPRLPDLHGPAADPVEGGLQLLCRHLQHLPDGNLLGTVALALAAADAA